MKRERDEVEEQSNKEPKKSPQGEEVTKMEQKSAPVASVDPSSHWKSMKIEDAISYLEQVKKSYIDRPEVYTRFLSTMKDFKAVVLDIPGVIARIKEMFKDHPGLIIGFNAFLPLGYEIHPDPNPEPPQPPKETPQPAPVQLNLDEAVQYISRIKQCLGPKSDSYKTFLSILQNFQQEKITVKKVFEQMSELLKEYQDLLEGFLNFLPVKQHVQKIKKKKENKKKATRRTSARKADEAIKKTSYEGEEGEDPLDSPGTQQLFDKIKARLGNVESYNEFLKCVNLYSTGVIGKQELINLSEDIIGSFTEFKQFKKLVSSSSSTLEEKFEKGKDLAFKQSSKYGPSYRLLPKNYPQAICSERDALCNEVLNDEFVSVVAGSEEGSGEFSRKSQADEILFQCEDDRCELDIVIAQNESTIIFLTPYALKLEKENMTTFKLEDMRDLHRASISRIYGDRGIEILEGLRKNPSVAIGVILKRLKQKDQEWRSARIELNKFWKEVYDKNYKKSYEIRSSEFKLAEKKTLSSKFILSDLEEMYNFSKNLEMELKDVKIHDDILNMVLGVNEIKDKEMIIKFWEVVKTMFLGPTPTNFVQWQSLKEVPRDGSNPTILFGNANLVLFYRFYMILFERLVQAHELATEIVKGDESKPIGDNATFNREEKEAQYKKFVTMTIQYVNGEMDSTRFEMDCRDILGYQSWCVHTVDKVLSSLAKQVLAIWQDAKAVNLIKAFLYEAQRTNPFSDTSLLTTACQMVQNEKLYSIEYRKNDSLLLLSLVDPTPIVPVDINALNYLEKFVSSTSDVKGPFLKRTLGKGSDVVFVSNGLENRLEIKGCKLVYVEDTEDVFYRKSVNKTKVKNIKFLETWTQKMMSKLEGL